jgi:ATP-dependent Clp protease protease subunit
MSKLIYILLLLSVGNILPTQSNSIELIELKKDNFVTLRETIDQDSSSKLLSKLNVIESKYEQIYLYINSPGGEVMAGLEIINYIKSLQQRSKIVTCIVHNAMSMAFVIFQYCSQRYILYSSTLMQHQMSLGVKGKLYDINSRLSYINSLENRLNQDQALRLNMTVDNFTKLIQNDWWLYSEDIISNNAADKIVTIYCSFENFDETILVQTMFGDISIRYSACPLINYPLHINFPTINFSEENKKDFIKNHINFMKNHIDKN